MAKSFAGTDAIFCGRECAEEGGRWEVEVPALFCGDENWPRAVGAGGWAKGAEKLAWGPAGRSCIG